MNEMQRRSVNRVENAGAIIGKFVRFASVGAVATGIQYAILILLVELGLAKATFASGIGFAVSAIANYLMNYYFTFHSRRAHVDAGTRFVLVASGGLILNTIIMAIGTTFLGVHYFVIQVIATSFVLIWNFSANYLWSFRDPTGREENRRM